MPESPISFDFLVVAGVAVAASLLLGLLRLPVIAGLLLAGALVGPYGFGLVEDAHAIESMAEAGVVLLLFTIGLEFSLARLLRIGRLVALGGSLQVGLTILCAVGIGLALGESPARGVFMGFVAALSSTAIVLRALSERGELSAPHGRFIVGAMIFQDLAVVPMMLVIPILAGTSEESPWVAGAVALGKAVLVVGVVLALARFLVPRLFAAVARSKSREIFLLTVLGVCVGTATMTNAAGLSLALGAFLAGMVLADSEYAHRAMAEVLPLRDVLTSLFFVSIGMLFDLNVLLEQPVFVAVLFCGLFFGKGALATLAGLVMRFPPRVAVLAGVGLAQFGEFGFVLAQAGEAAGLLLPEEARAILAAGVLTMFITPVAMRLSPHLAAGAARLKRLEQLLGAKGVHELEPEDRRLEGHVIVVGYGVAGRVLARALKDVSLPYLVIDLDVDVVRQARAAGEPVYYGDIASEETLAHAQAERARAVVLLVNDEQIAARAVAAARAHAPQTPIFIRTHRLEDVERLERSGASDVVVEEVEAGVEVLARVLQQVGMPRNVIDDRVRIAREATRRSGRRVTVPRRRLADVEDLDLLKVESYLVREGDFARGRSPKDLELRSRTGALLVALRRRGSVLASPDPAAPLESGDVLFLLGEGAGLRAAMALLEGGEAPPASP